MLKGLQLEQKLRRSEALTEQDIFHDFMDYAKQVSDQLEIYLYMQQNGIGTNSTQYWLARFAAMRQRGLYSSLADLIPLVKKMPEVQIDMIEGYEKKLLKDFERIICMPVSGRRKANHFFLQQVKHPEKRRIGNFEVFVDQECRKNYYLSDYARYIETQKKDYCQIQLAGYQREQSHKPPSFLAKNELHLIELAQQLFSKSGRLSLHNRNSLGVQRLSTKLATSRRQTFKEQDYNTPKCHQNSGFVKCSTNKVERDKSRDSVQILKQLRQKRLLDHRSPKFNQQQTENSQPFQKTNEEIRTHNVELERCRATAQYQTTKDQDFCFSFRKCRLIMSEQKQKKEKKRSVEDLETKDIAFIAYSFSKESNLQENRNLDIVNKEDFQLALLINEIQQEKYQKLQSKTFSSQIDSNQQNKLYHIAYPLNNPERQIFQELPITLNQEQLDNYDLIELMRESDDCLSLTQEKGRALQCHSQQKNRLSPAYCFRSERKRLSNISEEGSYSCSSRRKHCAKK